MPSMDTKGRSMDTKGRPMSHFLNKKVVHKKHIKTGWQILPQIYRKKITIKLYFITISCRTIKKADVWGEDLMKGECSIQDIMVSEKILSLFIIRIYKKG